MSDRVARRLAGDGSGGFMMSNINWMTNYWTVASVAEFQLGDFDTARKYYGLIVKNAPADPLVGAAMVALKRMNEKEAEVRRDAPPAS